MSRFPNVNTSKLYGLSIPWLQGKVVRTDVPQYVASQHGSPAEAWADHSERPGVSTGLRAPFFFGLKGALKKSRTINAKLRIDSVVPLVYLANRQCPGDVFHQPLELFRIPCPKPLCGEPKFGQRDHLSADEAQSGDLPVGLRDRDRDGEERPADPRAEPIGRGFGKWSTGNSEEGYQLREGNR